MNKLLKHQPIAVLNVIMGVILAATPFGLFHICTKLRPDGTPMMCHYTGKFLVLMGVLIVIFNLLALLLKKKWVLNIAYILTFISGALVYAIPHRIIKIGDKMVDGWQISYCMKDTMQCLHQTKPAVNIMVLIIILLSIVGLIMQFLSKEA